MLCGVAIAAFMPYCQVRGGNVIVDFFTMRLPPRARDALDAFMHLVVALVVAILTWKLIDAPSPNTSAAAPPCSCSSAMVGIRPGERRRGPVDRLLSLDLRAAPRLRLRTGGCGVHQL